MHFSNFYNKMGLSLEQIAIIVLTLVLLITIVGAAGFFFPGWYTLELHSQEDHVSATPGASEILNDSDVKGNAVVVGVRDNRFGKFFALPFLGSNAADVCVGRTYFNGQGGAFSSRCLITIPESERFLIIDSPPFNQTQGIDEVWLKLA